MKSKWVQLCVMGVLIAGLASVAQAQMFTTDTTPLMRFGPVDQSTGYPIWAEDSVGTQLELCFDTTVIPDPTPGCCAPPVCTPDNVDFCPPCPTCVDPALDLPFPNDPISFPDNFPDEAFFYSLNSLMDTNNGGSTLLVLALEAAFDGLGNPASGEQIIFSRLRIRIDNATGGESYKITHPYGDVTITADGNGARGINITNDVFLWKGVPLADPLRGNFGTFLLADGGIVPPGFLGDFCDVNTLMPGPLGENVFRIEGLNIGEVGNPFLCADATLGPDPIATTDCIETDLFALLGKTPTKFGAGIDRATFSRNATATQIDVWANSNNGATLEVSGSGIPASPMIEDPINQGHYYAHIVISSGFQIPTDANGNPNWNVSVTNMTDLITATVPLIDQVMFLGTGVPGAVGCSPTFDLNTVDPVSGLPSPTLSIAATSTNADAATSLSSSMGTGLGAGGTLSIMGMIAPPSSISVQSPSGGALELPVQILSTVTGPLAFAGPNQIVAAQLDAAGALLVPTVTLDGTGSSPATGLTYAWSQTGGANTVALTGGTTATPSFVFPNDGVALGNDLLNFTLTVTDTVLGATHNSVVTVTNAVIAHAGGPTITAAPQGSFTLDGTTSAGFGTLTYSWAHPASYMGPLVTLDDPSSPTPSFTFPVDGANVVGALPPNNLPIEFILTVSGVGGTSTDMVSISGPAGPPIANAGPDQSVIPGFVVQLDGSGIGLGSGVSWMWTQISGNAVTLGTLQDSGAILGTSNIPNPAFFWDVTIPVPQTMTFQLILMRTSDSVISASSTVDIFGANPNVPVVVISDPGKTQYDSGKGVWGIEGTTTPPGPGFSVTFYWESVSDLNKIGTANVDGGGKFKIQPPCTGTNGCPVPTNPATESLIAVISGAGFDGITTAIEFTIK